MRSSSVFDAAPVCGCSASGPGGAHMEPGAKAWSLEVVVGGGFATPRRGKIRKGQSDDDEGDDLCVCVSV